MISLLLTAALAVAAPQDDPNALEEPFRACWERNTIRYAATGEPAETVVVAAKAACEAERLAHRQHAFRAVGGHSQQMDDAMATVLDRWEETRRAEMIQRVLEERLKD